tara:strand:- start:3560 stop:3772 length:213 start_codon:yes stop_codon:yes gene_type:complete
MDIHKTIIVDNDVYEEKDGMKVLVARRGERVTPSFARKHGLAVESTAAPVMEQKVTKVRHQQALSSISHK